MRLSFTEILIVGLVITVVVTIARFMPAKSRQQAAAASKQLTSTEAKDAEILQKRHFRGKALSVVLIFAGIFLVMTAPNLLKMFFMSYVWGALIIIAGLALLYFMWRRK